MDPKNPNSANNNPAGQPDDNANKGDDQGSKTFSQDEVNEIVRKRINEANAKSEEKLKQAVADALAEQERKAKLTDEQRATEAQKAKEEEIAKREHDVTMRERRSEAMAIMAEQKLPTSMVNYLVDPDAEKTKSNITKFGEDWQKALEDAVKAKVGGSTPVDKSKRTHTQTGRSYGRDNGAGMTSF